MTPRKSWTLPTHDPPGLAHCLRFRKVSNRYPRRVAEAYDGDIARAAADSDEQVAATVAAWEQAHGLPVRDWARIGGEEEGRWFEEDDIEEAP